MGLAEPESTSFATRNSIEDVYGQRTPYHGKWPVRVDQQISEEPDEWIQSACIMCSNGCGVDIGTKNGRLVGVRGRAVDRVNHGRLGPKGMNCFPINHHQDRLLYPQIRKNGKLERATWDEAMDLIVSRTKKVQSVLGNQGIGFYTSGQLFLEEYYSLAVIGKAGLGTLHMDGNTRLCTATAAASMRENFGCDGQPGSYTDIDVTDCIFMCGHNMAATQTVLWTRILDRLEGPNPPQLIVMDPRLSQSAKSATIHLKLKIGTNVAVLNGIEHLLLKHEYIDRSFLEQHTIGFDALADVVAKYDPKTVEQISGVPADLLEKAAHMIGKSKMLLSTALQGIYQSNQATAAACQINNINLLLGRVGLPGSGIFQMNGQPTAQNNRETGCDGEYPGFRNNQNIKHMQELADHWNIHLADLPHYADPTHIEDMLSYIEEGSIKFFWVSGTNPLVSLPDLNRIRRLFTEPDFFLVVQDIFPTETTELADVVLPAAMWGEKTGCFTNVDRTVHISHKAVDPPGEARSDLNIFTDYGKRMNFKDKDGKPLIHWDDNAGAFEAWRKHSAGRPCDYSGITYEKLSEGSGVQWPCNEAHPNGTERLYTDHHFMTDVEECESYGHDLETGTAYTRSEYEAMNPAGRAFLKAAHYAEPFETTSAEYPFRLSTGRNVFHFHTRSKTGRVKGLQKAAPEATVQICASDAKELGIEDGDMVDVKSARGELQIKARIEDIEKGCVFIPFHYGNLEDKHGRNQVANDLTISGWDPVSKQPFFKSGAVSLKKSSDGVVIHTRQASVVDKLQSGVKSAVDTSDLAENRVLHLDIHLSAFFYGHKKLLELYYMLKTRHGDHFELLSGFNIILRITEELEMKFKDEHKTYDHDESVEHVGTEALLAALFPKASHDDTQKTSRMEKNTPYHILTDLHGLYMFLCHLEGLSMALSPALAAKHDTKLVAVMSEFTYHLGRQKGFVVTKLKQKGPQTLNVPQLVDR